VCGAAVYFWSNANGSRVFFDEMGPPWPKHPCTDFRQLPPAPAWSAPTWNRLSRVGRGWSSSQVARLSAIDFQRRYGTWAAEAYIVVGFRWLAGWTELSLRRASWPHWTATKLAPGEFLLQIGQFVFLDGDWLTYLEPAFLDVRQVRGTAR
jgi:hypothetical protein